jgi:hypothetical protein
MLINYTKDFHNCFHRLEIFNMKLILDIQNCTKSKYKKMLIYFCNTKHRVTSQQKSEIKTQLINEDKNREI